MTDLTKKSIDDAASGRSFWIRSAVQVGFVIFSLCVCVQFGRFVQYVSGDSGIAAVRPAGVEGYLPISSLMSLVHLIKSGSANTVRPAGLVIFTLTLVLAFAVRRGFCSWVCPGGTVSEWVYKFGGKVLGRNLRMPEWLDWIFMSGKYFLLGFFFYHILRMPVRGLEAFIGGDYNRIADVKMYLFFENVSMTTVVVFIVLGVLSMLFKNFWCRYLCPYGALLGLFSWFSPVAVSRDQDKCVQCGKCSKVCPNSIAVDTKRRVISTECTACYSCVKACGKKKALRVGLGWGRRSVSVVAYAVLTVGAFIFAAEISKAFGYWHTDTTVEKYRELGGNVMKIGHP